jgi:hypothetical protein
MKFSEQRIFAYDASRLEGTTLQELLSVAKSSDRAKFAMSGLEDLIESMMITQEWYHAKTPRILVKELSMEPEEVDDLYFEPTRGEMKTGRSLQIHSRLILPPPQVDYKKTGKTYTQPATLHFGLLDLYENDYFPHVGDRVTWLGRQYQMIKVYVLPNSMFEYTGIPLHVTVEADILRYGDNEVPTSINAQDIGNPTIAPN